MLGLEIFARSSSSSHLQDTLTRLGVSWTQQDDSQVVSFLAPDIIRLLHLPKSILIHTDDDLLPIWELLMRPSSAEPATLQAKALNVLVLSFFEDNKEKTYEIFSHQYLALLTLPCVFIASKEAWATLLHFSEIPIAIGKASINLVENQLDITTARPQLLEIAEIPGLYRETPTLYHAPLRFAKNVKNIVGISWEGPEEPTFFDTSPSLPNTLPLAPHLRKTLPEVTTMLSRYHGALLHWEESLGRRVMAVSVATAFGRWPILIVGPPYTIWTWKRILHSFNLTFTLDPRVPADVYFLTYNDLGQSPTPPSAQGIIFDEIMTLKTLDPESRTALSKLDFLQVEYRLGLTSIWPESALERQRLLSLIKPREFSFDLPTLMGRYFGNLEESANAHINSYLHELKRSQIDHIDWAFPHTQVRPVDTPPIFLEKQWELYEEALKADDPTPYLKEHLEHISSGTPSKLSPKLTIAWQYISTHPDIVILTRFLKTAKILENTKAKIILWEWGKKLKPLPKTTELLVCDYPLHYTELEKALRGPDPARSSVVTILHGTNSADDKLAVYAALNPTHPLDRELILWILKPRLPRPSPSLDLFNNLD
jgi:hypothetical protein